MTKPLEILEKILNLEEKDYTYQDKAVAGGLARYADTWLKQATQAFGEPARPWVEDIANRLRAYSSLHLETRPAAMTALRETLRAARAAAVPPSETPAEGPTPGTPPPPMERPSRDVAGHGLEAPVETLPGVGKKRAALLEKLGVKTIRDLLFFYPRRYEDYSTLKTINHLVYGERVSVLATVWDAGTRRTQSGRSLFRAVLSDNTGTLEVTWFNQPYLEERIRAGMQILVSGKVDAYLGRLTMNSPEWEIVGRTDLTNIRIQPIYPLTEGLQQRWMRMTMQRTLVAWAKRVPDALPGPLKSEHNLLPLERALWGIHLPDNREHLLAAQRRLAFEEALYLQLGLLRQRLLWKAQPGRIIKPADGYLQTLKTSLPYALTTAQQRSLDEMLRDLVSGQPMNRLLQGDVGAGKTVVAGMLMAMTAMAGFQAAMMAPTEILAEQHYKSLSQLFAMFPAPRPTLALLTGSTGGAERAAIYAGLADGALQTVVGTHALIQETVAFKDLGLVVVDEQHRFGVDQRGTLRQKGYNPHLLLMTATPIPRSLELTIWGHLDVSILDEMPPGRRPIETRVLQPRERERAYAFIHAQVQQGRQAFIIYPLVESSEKIEAKAAVDEYNRLQRDVFPDLRLGLLHGRLRPGDKEQVMEQFVHGDLDVLIATSVVEVGIDVPNATVMLIDGADRFGLAQLHQFRGRVGRGAHQSYCLLLADSAADEANERLQAVAATTDGFVLAQKDLEMRGPGEFLGTQQSGFPELPMAALADTRLLHEVRDVAESLLKEDPDLSRPEHQPLAGRVAAFWHGGGDLS
ncbi:MAG TPA: ATP-dependent DNA helicase RecG [Anaerolineae bacterium]|nr:ATP-dependent DNA helicase RecG [Anaerolineae bacterium]HQH37750.1 ATP-dependent DNA helicase RecG [Anaerolineae bacterium]